MTNMSSTPIKRVKPKPLQEVLTKVLQQLQKRDLYLFFAQPVNSAEVPNYYTIIKRPMDFGTMQKKLETGVYTTINLFKEDMLLVTGNAQYFNSIDGPSAIIHTEASKLADWGLKALAKEETAVQEWLAIAEAEAAAAAEAEKERIRQSQSPASSAPRNRISLKIRKSSSFNTTPGPNTPRLMTPSRLQHEIKPESNMSNAASENEAEEIDEDGSDEEEDESEDDDDEEDDDDDDDDDEDDDDDDDDDGTSSRAQSVSVDDSVSKKSKDTVGGKRRRRKSGIRRKTAKRNKKLLNRQSAIVAILGVSGAASKGESSKIQNAASDSQVQLAPVSTSSGAVASLISLFYRRDGAIDLEALTEDERRAVLRPSGSDFWPDVLLPFIQSLVPLHPDILPNAQTIERNIKDTMDGFAAALVGVPQSCSASYTYDLEGRTPEQKELPFSVSSGWVFEGKVPNIPMAWPRLQQSEGGAEKDKVKDDEKDDSTPKGRAPRKDKEKERDDEGLATLDDWTWPRAHLARLPDALDVGLFPGLLPVAWTSHINSQKGGPTRSRLPPHHLTHGQSFESALQDELSSLPHRVLLRGKPGVISLGATQPSSSPLDVLVAFEQAASRDWKPKAEDIKKLGARGCDVLREAVYGGPLGEAYASSVEDFVMGAARSAEENYDDDEDLDDEEVQQPQTDSGQIADPANPYPIGKTSKSYFDENGEMFDPEAYIGMDLVPIEVRKEAGISSSSNISSMRQSPQAVDSPRGVKRRSRSLSAFAPSFKRQATEELTQADQSLVGEAEENSEPDTKAIWEKDEHAAYMRGTVLDKSLYDHVREKYIAPLTNGQMDTLMEISSQLRGNKTTSDNDADLDMAELLKKVENVMPNPLVKQEDDEEDPMIFVNSLSPIPKLETTKELVDKDRIVNLVQLFINGDYHRARLQMHELIRAQGNAIDMGNVARTEMDIRDAFSLERSTQPLHAQYLPNPSMPIDHVLESYASVLQLLSTELIKTEGNLQPLYQDIVNRLRIAYITLGRRAPKLHLVPGSWNRWVESARKSQAMQDAHLAASAEAAAEEAKRKEAEGKA
ncbi:hypothetical protein L7F22_043509 [Adiantum nelumboides]|nr:hypothetical protein [Adiantum nelumboides]